MHPCGVGTCLQYLVIRKPQDLAVYAHGLYGVDDDYIGSVAPDGLAYALSVRHAQEVQRRRIHAQTVGAELYLSGALLSRYVQHRMALAEVLAYLEQQRRLTDARLTAQQYQRSLDQTTAQLVMISILILIKLKLKLFYLKPILDLLKMIF